MQFKNIGFRVPGLYAVALRALKETNMSATAERRREVLRFWEKHGLQAAMDFAGVSRSTLHAWRRAYRRRGAAGLASKSRAPHTTRRRNWPPALLAEIRRQREALPNMGPGKLHAVLGEWCAARHLPLPSARTIADAPDKMRITPQRLTPKGKPKPRKPAAPKPRRRNLNATTIGECVDFDTITLFVFGVRRHILTATDHHSRFAHPVAVSRATSKNAAQFAAMVQAVFPAPIQQVLTDNGSEFANHEQRNAFIHNFVAGYNHTRQKCLNYKSPTETLNNQTGLYTRRRHPRLQLPLATLPRQIQYQTPAPRAKLPHTMPNHRQTSPATVQNWVATYKIDTKSRNLCILPSSLRNQQHLQSAKI